jgi:glucose-6-phosphate 1-dehydrogenase
MTEIRIQFRDVPANPYRDQGQPLARNQLVIRVQPDEAITFEIVNKTPGLAMSLGKSELNLRYGSAFGVEIPDAYECLLLDVMEGNESLFIRSDELAAAWDVFTPILHEIERERREPDLYAFGTNAPARACALIKRYRAEWHQD